jgi:hypothetical protein
MACAPSSPGGREWKPYKPARHGAILSKYPTSYFVSIRFHSLNCRSVIILSFNLVSLQSFIVIRRSVNMRAQALLFGLFASIPFAVALEKRHVVRMILHSILDTNSADDTSKGSLASLAGNVARDVVPRHHTEVCAEPRNMTISKAFH